MPPKNKKRRKHLPLLIVLCVLAAAIAGLAFVIVFDILPPVAKAVPITSIQGEEVDAALFVTNIIDINPTTVSYQSQPRFHRPGTQTVTVYVTDTRGNRVTVKSTLTVLPGSATLELEAGSTPPAITAETFVQMPAGETAKLLTTPRVDTSTPGNVIAVPVLVYEREIECQIKIVDTTPPTATPVTLDVWAGDDVAAINFVTDIQDASPVTASYAQPTSFNTEGSCSVPLVLTDSWGNEIRLTATAIVTADTEPPTITGAQNQTVFLGARMNYRTGVTVTDNRDEDVQLQIDAAQVNVNEPGVYPVTYSATDKSGNHSKVTVRITVLNVDEDTVNTMLDEVLSGIVTPDMNPEQTAKSIYNWVRNHIRYVGTGKPTGVLQGAYEGLLYRRGDCYVFYAVSEALLSRAGIETVGVTRQGGASGHYWNLININGGWYHFDTCPTPSPSPSFSTFMFTDSQAKAYTRQMGEWWSYYQYDTSLYPPVVE